MLGLSGGLPIPHRKGGSTLQIVTHEGWRRFYEELHSNIRVVNFRMGGTCSRRRGNEKFLQSVKGGDHYENLHVDELILLKLIF